MAAAIASAGCGHEVHLYEKNEKPGKKLFITGKGRCNVTNACSMESLRQNVVTNPRFLYSSFSAFSNRDMMELLERAGCPLKVERGERVFPVSDKSSDVIAALIRQMKELGVRVHLNTEVTGVRVEAGKCSGITVREKQSGGVRRAGDGHNRGGMAAERPVMSENGAASRRETPQGTSGPGLLENGTALRREAPQRTSKLELSGSGAAFGKAARKGASGFIPGDAVIVATGGLSYESTGSTGDGYRFARDCGHTVTRLRPSLVPMTAQEEDVKSLQGLSLKNVEISVYDGGRELYREFGEMLFTHFGVSGPAVLSASCFVGDALKERPLTMQIDLKPALSEEQLDARLLRDFAEFSNRQFANALGKLYPAKLIPVMVARSGISPVKPVRDITRQERMKLLDVTKRFAVTLTGLRGFNEAIITQGGISVKEISPSTMESKRVRGLYFAGEVLDLDAVTGGFNLQIAWSTGWAAGSSIPWE